MAPAQRRMSRLVGHLAFVVVSTLTASAHADGGSDPAHEASHEADPPKPYEHHGFYLNLALGLGHAAVDTSTAAGGEAHVRSLDLSSQALIGGSLARGLVLGGGTTGNTLFAKDGRFGVLGAFVTFYPNPKGGLHVFGLVGIGSYGPASRPRDARLGVGPGGTLGLGYDWWVGGDWSMGVIARGTWIHTAATEGTQDSAAASVLFSVTYN